MTPELARAEGICFYDLPADVDYSKLDALIAPICKRINESGWVWTAESCQGHPDATDRFVWAGNTRPMLRLVTTRARYGEMLDLLLAATEYWELDPKDQKPNNWSHHHGLELWEHKRTANFVEILIYMRHSGTVYSRNLGLECYARFAEAVNGT